MATTANNNNNNTAERGSGSDLAVHEEAAVPREADHLALRVSDLGGDGGGQAVAHRAGGGSELRPVVLAPAAIGRVSGPR